MAEEVNSAAHAEAPHTDAAHGAHQHPGAKTYIIIGLILTIITAVEVAIFYIPALKPALVPVLLTLSAIKFALVVLFYMHLRFDAKVFSSVFFAPMFLAMLVIIGLLVIFKVVPQYNP